MPPGSPSLPGPALPIDEVLDDLKDALTQGHAVLQAPTGSGKSTKVPLALLHEKWLGGKRILMLEPRRPAARLTAIRMASILGESVAATVGYQVRFERRVSRHTRIEVITEGILTRRLQSDPALEDTGLVIFDEFHEMNLHSALGLALTLDVVENLRPDLRILAMSATLDTGPVAEMLGGAVQVQGQGRSYPVTIHYAQKAPDKDPVQTMAAGVREALSSQDGDLLAFLPGSGEIGRCLERLSPLKDHGIDLLPLHGSLAAAEQDRALLPGGLSPGRRRVVLATDIAETSVTIQGIGAVVDSGLTRKPRFEPGSGLSRLVTEAISRASADQRAGRAGRLGPGVCFRLWTKSQEHGRPEHRTPEILQSDLAPLALELALWGVKEPMDLKWINPPPLPAWRQAVELLTVLGALDNQGALTRLGRAMAGLPVHPRLAVMLLRADAASRGTAADLCALVSERDPIGFTRGRRRPADMGLRLQGLQAFRHRQRPTDMDHRGLGSIDRVAKQLLRLVGKPQNDRPSRPSPTGRGATATPGPPATSPGELLALAYPDRVAQRREGADGRYLLARGTGAALPPDDALAVHPYLSIATMDGAGRDGRIRLALPVSEAELRSLFPDRIHIGRSVFWDPEREAVVAREVTTLGAITLEAHPARLGDSEDVTGMLLHRVREDIEGALNWTDESRQLRARISLMREQEPQGAWPDISGEGLRSRLQDWLGPWLAGKSRLADIKRLDVAALLTSMLDWEQQRRLEREAPPRMKTPAGNTRPLDYASGDVPILAVPLQEMLGAAHTPRVCGGRVPILLHLLSPARRPIQVTQDLAGFWAGSYSEVRKEMRGRYPKHHWPEDPAGSRAIVGSIERRRS